MTAPSTASRVLLAGLLAVFVTVALFAWEGRVGFNLGDEGYLWYGVQAVLRGEVPKLDFMAYDPGRYYLSAWGFSIAGDSGIITLRIVLAVVQAAGLAAACALLSLGARKLNWLEIAALGTLLAMWMFPRHKLFDISASIMLVAGLAFVLAKPLRRRWFAFGVLVGLIAVLGRNHGVYGAIGSLLAMAYIAVARDSGKLREAASTFALWAAGVTIGFSPIFLMMATIPGYAHAFVDSILFLFEIRNTNLPLPVPLPWSPSDSEPLTAEGLRVMSVGVFFLALVAGSGLGTLAVFLAQRRGSRISPVVSAGLLLSVPYIHVAYSRADVGHLAQAVFPLLIAASVAILNRPPIVRQALLVALAVPTALAVAREHPGWQCRESANCVEAVVAGETLLVTLGTAGNLAILREVTETYAPDGQAFVATPFVPGAYAIAQIRSPVWEIYALFPRSPAFEEAEIERIRGHDPAFVLITDVALDGREELRFRNTHPLIYQYVLENFILLPSDPRNPTYKVFLASGRGP